MWKVKLAFFEYPINNVIEDLKKNKKLLLPWIVWSRKKESFTRFSKAEH